MSLLEVRGLTVSYGPVLAVRGVDLEVDPGQIVGLIGPNGAGKTSTIDAITGFEPSRGLVEFDGVDLSDAPAHSRSRAGLARTWQSLELFDDLTVRDNLRVAADHHGTGGGLRRLLAQGRDVDGAVDEALARLGIDHLAARFPNEISQGHRKMVSSARALAARPRVVCMDEPAAGLDSDESRQLGERLVDLAASGLGILLVDHDMSLVLEVCDHIVVMDAGAVIASDSPNAIRRDPRVLDAYLGAVDRDGGTS